MIIPELDACAINYLLCEFVNNTEVSTSSSWRPSQPFLHTSHDRLTLLSSSTESPTYYRASGDINKGANDPVQRTNLTLLLTLTNSQDHIKFFQGTEHLSKMLTYDYL